MRFAKYSPSHTKAAKFKDRRSKIGVRPDGSLRYDLAGLDKSRLRANVFDRDYYTCVDSFKNGGAEICVGPIELSHWPPMSKAKGSDEEKTCFTRCRKHHRLLDNNQVKWTRPDDPQSQDLGAKSRTRSGAA